MHFTESEALTFDDVLIAPGYSEIVSRSDCNTGVNFLGLSLTIPIISSNMDLVTGNEMANAMWTHGGLGILHRFKSDEEFWDDLDGLSLFNGTPVAFSVGIRDIGQSYNYVYQAKKKYSGSTEDPIFVTIDVAHGHHYRVAKLIQRIKSSLDNVYVIAGNVATAEGTYFLVNAGADAIKVGIGPGAVCTTRVVTGIGVPQLSAIAECSDAVRPYKVPIIADGGIRSSGDIVKAIAAGADVVMLGQLLAGAKECPGEVIVGTDGRRYRRYTGQSVYGVNGYKYTKEGVAGFVEEKGEVGEILRQLVGGIRSGMSYVGARNLTELKEKATFIKVSHHTHAESQPRVREYI